MELNVEMTLDYLDTVNFCPYIKDCSERDECGDCPANNAEELFSKLYTFLVENA